MIRTLKKEVVDEIELFLKDILTEYNLGIRDFRPLYAKYPNVRICCRRAILIAEKKYSKETAHMGELADP